MTDERWENLIDQIEEKFGELERKKEALEPGPGKKETIIFNSALGKMKIERTVRPLVLEERGIKAKKRIGAKASIEYIYSETEKVDKIQAFRWDEKEDDWIKIDMENFGT